MKWFRLYSSVLDDPKVQQLSPSLFKHWINLLCLANEHEPRGELPPLNDIAFRLRIKPSEAAKVMRQLEDARLIDGENSSENRRTFLHNWPQRQRASDDVSTRVADFRKRKAGNDGESEPGAIRNVTLQETLLKRPVDTDTEKETEGETFPLSGNVSLLERERTPERAPLSRTRTPSPQKQKPRTQSPEPIPLPVPAKSKPVNPLWDVLCEMFYQPTTKVERSNFGKIVRELGEIGATPDAVRWRMRQHQKAQNHWDMTPNALVKHWSELGNHNGKAASPHVSNTTGTSPNGQPGTNRQNGVYDPEQDEAFMERRAAARLVRQLGQQQTS